MCVIVNTLLLLVRPSFAVMEFNIQVGLPICLRIMAHNHSNKLAAPCIRCQVCSLPCPCRATWLQACAPCASLSDPSSNQAIIWRCIPNEQADPDVAIMCQTVMQLPCSPQTDPEAARIVFEAGVPLTMVPLEVTHTALATTSVLQVGAWEGGKVGCMLVCVLWR